MDKIIFFRKPIPNSDQKVTVIKILPQSEPTKISNQNEEEDVKCHLCSKCFNFKFLLGLHMKQVTKLSIKLLDFSGSTDTDELRMQGPCFFKFNEYDAMKKTKKVFKRWSLSKVGAKFCCSFSLGWVFRLVIVDRWSLVRSGF
jgi:hypothetical protein